ncbi:uncharacterized protein LOC108856556 [Raphanus sativus]|uniref:Uncharacterized protein LOC108856556 n=1 Tax=Raphanus sativus TaxID=3726 RepID=A0A6J0NQD9_RAPSA|nr:uncharacterized protein LOC108856556 [Raphanus sativus]
MVDQKNLGPQPMTPFSALTPHRAIASRPRRLISATTLEMILEEETAPEENRSSADTAMDSLVVFPATSFLLYGSCKCP